MHFIYEANKTKFSYHELVYSYIRGGGGGFHQKKKKEKKSVHIVYIKHPEKVNFGSQILERPSIGEYWNIFSLPVLPENVIFMFFRTCWCYSEAYNTGT